MVLTRSTVPCAENNVALCQALKGDHVGAAKSLEKVLLERAKLLGRHHPQTLSCANNLACVRSHIQGPSRALRNHTHLTASLCHVLGSYHPWTLCSRNNVACQQSGLGDNHDAYALHSLVCQQRQHVLGSEHQDTLSSRSNAALELLKLGRAAEAVSEFREIVRICANALGREHPDTLRNLGYTGHALLALAAHQRDEAAQCFGELQQALQDDHRLGPSHAHVIFCMRMRARALHENGQQEEAEQLAREADEQQASQVPQGSVVQSHPVDDAAESFDILDRNYSDAEDRGHPDASPSAPDWPDAANDLCLA